VNVVYDTGVLVAADRGDRRAWADHRVRLELGLVPVVPAPVVAQASRSPRQVPLRRLLRGCTVVPFGPDDAHPVGELLSASGTADVVDAHVVLVAAARGALVVTSDEADLRRLADHLSAPPAICSL